MHQLTHFGGLFAQALDAQTISTTGLINSLVPLVGLVGVCVMLWGAYGAVVRQIATETSLARGQTPTADAQLARPPFAHYLSLGLEFMIAAAAIKTLVTPDLQQVGVLGGMVISRAVVGLYPRWEKGKFALSAGEPEAASRLAVAADSGDPVASLPRAETLVDAALRQTSTATTGVPR
ncbi:MAG TPA: DUF1622 domain-containing protein [Pirellulales bacterium]|jgi:uncharacterized membrane protein